MRILYTNFHHGWGGQPYQVLLLAQAMRARGHEVMVASPPGSVLAQRVAAQGIAVCEEVRFARGFRPRMLWQDRQTMRRVLDDFSPDVVHAHGSQDSWCLATAFFPAWHRRIVRVRTKHNSYPPKNHAFNRWLFRRFFDSVVVVADPLGTDLLAHDLVMRERLLTIPAACDVATIMASPRKDRESVRASFGIAPEDPVVVLVGRLAPDKGQEMLLRAMPSILPRIPTLKALFVGKGGDNERLLGIRAELGLETSAIMAGFREDVADVTAAADCAVLAATACDASSTVLKEAMALGVPVVGTDVGGTADILGGGRYGVLIPPGNPEALSDAITDVFLHPDAARQRADDAMAAVSRFACATIAGQTEALYQKLLASESSH